jgi:hypothetical protein
VVRLQANHPRASLQQLRHRWEDVCLAPCNVAVDPGGSYRVGGASLRPTATFQVPRPSGDVLVTAHVKSRARRLIGIGLTAAGLGGIVLGSVAASSGTLPDTSDSTSGSSMMTADARPVGVAMIGVGVAALVIGIIVWAKSGSSFEVQ